MARYGKSAEDFNRESAALEAAMKARRGVAAAEADLTGALDSSSGALERSTRATRLNKQAKQEAADFNERAVAVEGQGVEALNMETAALERNAAARRRMAQASASLTPALRGAGDPLFGRAYGMADPTTGVSQYELRRQLQIGSSRASQLQAAIGMGFRPGGPGGVVGATTRAQAAQQASIQADIDLAAAKRAYTQAINRGDAAAAQVAQADREAAEAARVAARSELESANKIAAARDTAAAAIERDAAAAGRAGVQPGTAIIRHPTLYGQPAYGEAQAIPPTARPMRENPTRLLGGDSAHDTRYEVEAAKARDDAVAIKGLAAARMDDERAARLQLHADVQTMLDGQAAAEHRVATATRYSSTELAAASQQMTRHGALTSEFITAAYRGETTLRELGNQALVTAGKFTAWTLAATAIYGVAAALHTVGQGAIQSANGVGQLRRFIPNVDPQQAQQGFRDTAQFANVPIKEVVDAQSQFARVYHSQADSLEASRAALLATKLDNISAADSFNYLTAGARGFNLSARDMMPLLAQINAGQNLLGARVSETVPAFGRSAAAIKNAGGNLNEFLAIIFTMQRATGLTGLNISTILSRSATRFVHTPKNEAELRRFGLDPSEGYTQLIIDAVGKAQRLGPEDRRQLANALGGPQLGSRGFVGLLSRPDLLSRGLQALGDPAANQRLLEHERQQVLNTPSEQIHQVGVNLSRLGSALGTSGLGTPALLFLKTLNLTLDTAVHLVEVFDKIPEPLRTGLALAVELFAAMKLMQRFGANIPVVNRLSPGRRDAGLIMSANNAAIQEGVNERERLRMQQNRAAQAAQREQNRLTQYQGGYREAEAAGTLPAVGTEERAAIEQKLVDQQERVLRQAKVAEELEMRLNDQRMLISGELEIQTQLLAAKRVGGYAGVVEAGQRMGLPQRGDFNIAGMGGAVPAGGRPALAERPGVGRFSGLPMVIPAGMTAEEAGAVEAETEATNATRTKLGAVTENMDKLGASGKALSAVTEGGVGVVTKAGGNIGRAAKGVLGLGKSILASLGPLDILLAGFITFESVQSAVENQQKRANAIIDSVKGDPLSNQAAVAKAGKQLKEFHPLQSLQNAYADAHNWVTDVTGLGGHVETQNQVAQQIVKADQSIIDTVARMQQYHDTMFYASQIDQQVQAELGRIRSGASDRFPQQAGLSKTHPRGDVFTTPLVSGPAILGHLAVLPTTTGQYTHPLSVQQQEVAALHASIQQARDSIREFSGEGSKGQADAARRELARLQAQLQAVLSGHSDSLSVQWAGLTQTPKLFAARVKQDADAITAYFSEWGKLRGSYGMPDLRAAYGAASRAAHAHPTAANLADLNTISSALQQVGQQVVSRYQDDMTLAKNANDRAAAYEHAVAAIKQLPSGRIRNLARQQLNQASFQADEQAAQIGLAYRQSMTTDKSAQGAMAINEAAQMVRLAARQFGVGSDQWKQAMTNLNQARQSRDQQIQADIQGEVDATNALITARASGDPSGRSEAIAGVTVAKNALQAVLNDRTLKGKARTNAIHNAEAGVITAQLAENNYFTQQAAQITQARYALKESQTDDPVKQAQDEMEAARAAIASATDPASKITARADYNNKRRALLQARVTAREDDIDFDLQMGKITQAQAISQLQAILNMHNLTKKMRRDIQLKIKQLQDQSNQDAQSFDLAVGAGVKLPTIYDVRRAVSAVRQAGDAGTHVTSNNQINLKVEVNDPKAAGAVYEALDQAMSTTIASSMRQAGVSL